MWTRSGRSTGYNHPVLIRPALLPSLPPDPQVLFGCKGPSVLEIGFGDGRFTAWLAKAHPEWNILGAEVSAASLARAWRRMRREGIRNVRLYHGEGRFALRNLFAEESLQRVYVNFPDPWPKKRHWENRLLKEDFFRLLSTRLLPGGSLLLTTDHEEYLDFAREEAKRTGLFQVELRPPPEAHLKTKYALRWKAEGRPFFHAVFTRIAKNPTPFPPIRRYTLMPHALLAGELPETLPVAKRAWPLELGAVVFLEVAKKADGFYVLTRVEEEDLVQEILLEVKRSQRGAYAGLARFGAPLVTEGLKKAVELLVGVLEELGLRVVQRSY